MTADEILKALEESEGFYLEVGDWVVAKQQDENPYGQWAAIEYKQPDARRTVFYGSMREAVTHALKDGKP